MESRYTIKNKLFFAISIVAMVFFTSCGITQNTTVEDGIYANESDYKNEKTVSKSTNIKTSPSTDNHFTKELQRIDDLNGTDIITDIDSYKSGNYKKAEASSKSYENKSSDYKIEHKTPWGYNPNRDSNVIVTINSNDYYWRYNRPYVYDNWGWSYGHRYYRPYWYNDYYWSYNDYYYYNPYRYYTPYYYRNYNRYYDNYYYRYGYTNRYNRRGYYTDRNNQYSTRRTYSNSNRNDQYSTRRTYSNSNRNDQYSTRRRTYSNNNRNNNQYSTRRTYSNSNKSSNSSNRRYSPRSSSSNRRQTYQGRR